MGMDQDPKNQQMGQPEAGPDADMDGAEAPKKSIKRFLPLVAIAGVAGLAIAFDLHTFLSFDVLKNNRDALMTWHAENPVLAPLVFIAIYAVMTAVSLPGAVWLTLAAGFVFGTVAATLIVVSGATLGAVGIFLAAKYALGDILQRKAQGTISAAVKRMEAGFKENALSYLLVLRLVPLFPFWLVNLVPALLNVPLRTYVVGTFLGIIPGTAVYCSVGNGLGAIIDAGDEPNLSIIFQPDVIGPLVGLAVLSMVPVVYKKFKKA